MEEEKLEAAPGLRARHTGHCGSLSLGGHGWRVAWRGRCPLAGYSAAPATPCPGHRDPLSVPVRFPGEDWDRGPPPRRGACHAGRHTWLSGALHIRGAT